MKITDLKDFEKLVKLCRKLGVDAVEADGVKFNLGASPKPKAKYQDPALDIPESQVKIVHDQVMTQTVAETVADVIKTDELSAEDLLFYSASGQTPNQEQQ